MDEAELMDELDLFETRAALTDLLSAIDFPSEPREWRDVVSFTDYAVIGFLEA